MFIMCKALGYMYWRCAVLSRSVMSDSVTPWTVVLQAPLSTGILQARILEWDAAGVQPPWIQGIQSGDGIGELDTIALIKY